MAAARSAVFHALQRVASPAGDGPRTRVVARLRVHGAPIDFRELCRRAVPPSTKILVLDLDRTIHFGHNMGELLGWEICGYLGYGPAFLDEPVEAHGGGRRFLDPSRLLASLRFLALGARLWAPPGLFYLLWGKLAWRTNALRRRAFRRFGPEAVRTVQRVPQNTLLHQIAALPRAVVSELAARVYRRHAGDQTIEREDLDWLRARCPGLRIVISSASPRPTVALVSAALGVDDFICSEVEDDGDGAAAPCDLSRPGRPPGPPPRRISRPSRQHFNNGSAKLDALVERLPDLLDTSVESVGMSDTGYGEDHLFAELLGTVIDVNSGAPFPPILSAGSPTRAIHSALLCTRRERDARAAGQPWLDPRRGPAPAPLDLGAAELLGALGPLAGEVEALARAVEVREHELAVPRDRARAALLALAPEIERAVERYNAAGALERTVALRTLEDLLAEQRGRIRNIVAIERPLSAAACALTTALERARARLVGLTPAAPGLPAAVSAWPPLR